MRGARCAGGEGVLEVIHVKRVIVVEGGVEMSLTWRRMKGRDGGKWRTGRWADLDLDPRATISYTLYSH